MSSWETATRARQPSWSCSSPSTPKTTRDRDRRSSTRFSTSLRSRTSVELGKQSRLGAPEAASRTHTQENASDHPRTRESGAAKEIGEDYSGYVQKKIVALREPDLLEFSAEEIESVLDMVRQFWGKNAKEVSDISHEDPGWRAIDLGETIPLELVFVARPEVTDAL